jgi:adenylate cyclase
MTKKKTRAALNELLQERNEYPERIDKIDARIREVFSELHAIMVMDMSGFSRLTIKHGIIHFLAMIHRMNEIASPTIKDNEGTLVKFEADNAFAIFPDVKQAVEASVDIMKRLSAANTMLPDELDMYGKFGIGYGEVLLIEDEDLFGAEVNLASKLGEDLAQRGEILLTEAAFSRMDKDEREYEEIVMSVSGLELIVHKIKYEGAPPC